LTAGEERFMGTVLWGCGHADRQELNSNGAITRTLGWDGMGWAALVTQCVNASTEIHWAGIII